MKLPDRVYKILKWTCLVALPATSTLYAALGATWGFSYVSEICQTFAAVELFLGALIGISTVTFNKDERTSAYRQLVRDLFEGDELCNMYGCGIEEDDDAECPQDATGGSNGREAE